jgi:hypothetical protein
MPTQKQPGISNISFLRQGEELIQRLGGLYTGASELVPGGTVGSHFRHCLDFYVSFLRGLETGEVDYDSRDRTPQWETSPERALAAIARIVQDLEALQAPDVLRPLQVRGDGPQDEEGWSGSTIGRELQYLLSHTIHHYALIGSILRARGFELGPDFGVAPSTLRHWGKAGGVAS